MNNRKIIGILVGITVVMGGLEHSVFGDIQIAPHISELKKRLFSRPLPKKPAITNVRATVRDEAIHAITKEIRDLKEIIQSLLWFDNSMRSGKLKLDGYAKSVIEHALEICDELGQITTTSDIDGAKFATFDATVQKMIKDQKSRNPQNIGVLRRYILNRLIHRYDALSRLLMRRSSVSPVKDVSDLEKIYTTFGYNFTELYRILKIPAHASLQDVTHIIATYFAPAIEEGNVTFQQVLTNAYKALVQSKGFAFLINQQNLAALGSSENIGTQLAVIFEYVSRQKSLYRSFREKEAELRGQYSSAIVTKARYVSYALSTLSGIWEQALKSGIARWSAHNKAKSRGVIDRFDMLMKKSRSSEATWTIDELKDFMKRL